VSAAANQPIDLRSIYFAWLKKDVAIPEYIASAQELNAVLESRHRSEAGATATAEPPKVLNLVFVERLDLITWLEGASEESEYIKPLEGVDAGAATAAAAATQAARDSAAVASGAAGGVPTVSSGDARSLAAARAAGKGGRVIDPRLQEIYNGERKMGDRNSVLRGIRPTVGYI
jgi:parafibromin